MSFRFRPRVRPLLLLVAVLAALAALDAFWVEPHLLLARDRVAVDLVPGRLRMVQLSDLHMEADEALYERLLQEVAAARPDLVLVSGDFVDDVHDTERIRRHARSAAAWVSRLRAIAPVMAVQGHSDYLGEVVGPLAASGVEWLSNEGRRIGPPGAGDGILLLGLDQQVGHDAGREPPRAFHPAEVDGEPVLGARPRGTENSYLSYDPLPAGADLATASGPLAWSGYDAAVSVRITDEDTGAGLAVHSRRALGEDRVIRLARARDWPDERGTFTILLNGTAATSGAPDTGVAPQPGRWYRLRMQTEVTPERVRVRARAWPEGEAEPAGWQAWAEDRSGTRIAAGTVSLWTFGGGEAAFHDLRVERGGEVLLARAFDSSAPPAGFREGTRATRLEMALARSPEVPRGTPRIVLTHSPDAVVEAARHGIRLVLAGHTHGGQVRLPFVGALITRTEIGRRYDRGLFTWPGAANGAEPTLLFVNAGVGTSLLPVRFLDPPTYAVIDF